jgi:hypothetical protein
MLIDLVVSVIKRLYPTSKALDVTATFSRWLSLDGAPAVWALLQLSLRRPMYIWNVLRTVAFIRALSIPLTLRSSTLKCPASTVTLTVWPTRTVTRPAGPTDLTAHDARNKPKPKHKQKPKVKEE